MFKLVPGPSPIEFTSIATANGTNVASAWTGGQGPCALQAKSSLSDPTWINVDIALTSNAIAATDSNAGFFRLGDTAHQPAIPLSAHLSGANERPIPLTNSGAGFGLFSLDGNTLVFSISYTGLSGVATMAHIHGPATSSQATNVLIDLAPFNGGSFGTAGSLVGAVTLTPPQLGNVVDVQTYVNIHTTNFPGGEIRGQLTR